MYPIFCNKDSWWTVPGVKAGTRGGLCLQIKIENNALEGRITCEVNFFWKMDKSKVIMKGDLAVLFMDEEVSCYQFNSAFFCNLPDVMSAQHHFHLGGVLGKVSISQNPRIWDQGSTTEPLIINKESSHPWVGVSCRLSPTSQSPAMLLVHLSEEGGPILTMLLKTSSGTCTLGFHGVKVG